MYQLSKRFGAYITACASGVLGCTVLGTTFPEKASECFLGGVFCVGSFFYFFSKTSEYDILFENLKLGKGNKYPIKRGEEKKDGYTQLRFSMPAGLTLKEVLDNIPAFEAYCGKPVEFKYTYKELVMKIYDSTLPRIWRFNPALKPSMNYKVCFLAGINLRGQPVWCDLTDADPHVMIGGSSGCGKSVLIRCIITYLILAGIELYLVDLKEGVEFQLFENSSLVKGFATSPTQCEIMLTSLENEMNKRYKLFKEKGVVNILQYNKIYGKTLGEMPFKVIIIDEFADLRENEKIEKIFMSLVNKARAAGIRCIIAAQRLDSKLLDGNIKQSLSTVIGLKTANQASSRVIWDKIGLEDLRGRGHAMMRKGCYEVEMQCPFLEPEEATELIKHTYKQPSKTEKAEPPEDDDGDVII